MSLFLLTFFLIYGGTHLYFFLKLKTAVPFGPTTGFCLACFLLVMLCAPVLVRMLEREGMETQARVLAYAGYLWMGFLFLFFSSSLALDVYRGLLWVGGLVSRMDMSSVIPSHRVAFMVPFAWGVGCAVYGYFEARDIRVERIALNSPKVPPTTGKLTIVQISDVHLGLIVRKERLTAMLDKVRQADPDILVSTGDLVDGQINGLTGLAELLRDIRPRYGKFAVTGNHEVYVGLNHALAFMRSAGFKVLRGEEVTIPGVATIAGVDDPTIRRSSGSADDEERGLVARLPRETFTVLLKHRPVLGTESLGRFDLQLSGHVHKGQLFPFNFVTYLFYPVKAGLNLYRENTALYVSRGTGTWGPPIRFLAPPEVTVIEVAHGPGGGLVKSPAL